MKIYASGLGADERVFKYLTINYELIPVKWFTPKHKETIQAYSKKKMKNTAWAKKLIMTS